MEQAGQLVPLAGKKVFVTGHTGFKGSWLLLLLDRLGARTTGYSLAPPTSPSLFEAAGLVDVVGSHHEADIRDTVRLAAAVRDAAPDVVLHLAAQPLVRLSHREPLDTFSTNVLGTASLLDAVRQAGRPCVVLVVTSDKCYEPHADGRPHAEADRLGGHDPYSASKGATELVVEAYRRSFFPPARLAEHGVQLATVRAGNVIGGGDVSPDRLLPDLMRGFAAGESVPLRFPDAVRPWQHVLDCLNGYLMLIDAMLAGAGVGAWNIGPDPAGFRTVREVAERAAADWGDGAHLREAEGSQPHEAALLTLDAGRARRELGWHDRLSVDDAVRWTVDWTRLVQSGASARDVTRRQIEAFDAADMVQP